MGGSQIYVRLNDEFGRKFLLARHFYNNMQERMISRARGIIEYLYDNRKYADILTHFGHLEELSRYMEVNWDYHSIEVSKNIIQDYLDNNKNETFKEFVFDNQESEDGQLFIDLQADFKHKNKDGAPKCIIKYAFCINYDHDDCFIDGIKARKIYGPDEYMQQDFARMNQKTWRSSPMFGPCLKFTERNISYIEKHAKRMTEIEALEFMEYDYTKDLDSYNQW